MPSISLDTDEKYTNLVEIFQNLNKNSQSDNTKCKIFDNVTKKIALKHSNKVKYSI